MGFKKAEIPAQIFIYVSAIILFSLILIYGYNTIKGFREKSEQIAYIKFKTDLTSTVEKISSDYGTIKREEFFIGGKYTKVCFVQNYQIEDYNLHPEITENVDELIINNSVKSNVNKNVFLFANTLQESFDVGEINVSDGYLCVNLYNGKIKIQLEGKGDHTYIAKI